MNELEVVNPSSINLLKQKTDFYKETEMGLQVIKKLLDSKSDAVVIRGKRYIEYEDWIALGNAYGITVETGEAEPVEIFEATGFKAKAKVIKIEDGTVIGGAEAYCLDNEDNWRNKDYFQLASMAQTRAGSKALANALRFVVALDKTISGTPAEEMENSRRKFSSKPRKDEATIPTNANVVLTLDEAIERSSGLRDVVEELESMGSEPTVERILDKLMKWKAAGKINTSQFNALKKTVERIKEE